MATLSNESNTTSVYQLNTSRLTGQSDEVSSNALDGRNLGVEPYVYEIIDDKSGLTREFGRIALDTPTEIKELALKLEPTVPDSSREEIMKSVLRLRDIIERSGNFDTHPQIPSVVHELSKYLESDEQLPESIKAKIVEQTENLSYKHPNTIRLSQIKSDLEQAADNIESIVSN